MLFDTDMFIWVQRGNEKAARLVDRTAERYLSIQSCMELLQGARSKTHIRVVKDFLIDYGFNTLRLTENIGHRAAVYIEEYALASGLRAGDAIVAATATEHNLPLVSSNAKHFKPIRDLQFEAFRP